MKLIQAMGSVSLSVGTTPIGILATYYPTWGWYVRSMGKVKWLFSGEDLPGRMEGDPIWYGLGGSREELEEIEVLLVQGDWELI